VPHVTVDPSVRGFDAEVAYRVPWDEEHTLGARLAGGALVELCGSV